MTNFRIGVMQNKLTGLFLKKISMFRTGVIPNCTGDVNWKP